MEKITYLFRPIISFIYERTMTLHFLNITKLLLTKEKTHFAIKQMSKYTHTLISRKICWLMLDNLNNTFQSVRHCFVCASACRNCHFIPSLLSNFFIIICFVPPIRLYHFWVLIRNNLSYLLDFKTITFSLRIAVIEYKDRKSRSVVSVGQRTQGPLPSWKQVQYIFNAIFNAVRRATGWKVFI